MYEDVSIPYDILYELLLKSTLPTIAKLCQVKKEINTICNNEHFWEIKTRLSFSAKTG